MWYYSTPFHPLLTSQWKHEGQLLLSSDSNYIILTDFIITLTSVQQNQSGVLTYVPTAIRDGRS